MKKYITLTAITAVVAIGMSFATNLAPFKYFDEFNQEVNQAYFDACPDVNDDLCAAKYDYANPQAPVLVDVKFWD